MKKCSKCKMEKQLTEFHKHKNHKDGYQNQCKSCMSEYQQNNKESISEYQKSYQRQNKARIAEYKKERRSTDPQFKLAVNLRSRLNMAIKNGQKSGSAVRDLGCSIEFLINYFDSYSLDRYGIKYTDYPELFDIDHYKPLSTFDLNNLTDFRVANNWLNLRPLLKKENLQKSDRQLPDQQHCDFLFFILISSM